MEDHLRRHNRRIMNMVRVGKLSLATDETKNVQTLQVVINPFEVVTANSLQFYGVASAAPIGTDVILLNIAGENSNATAIASGHNSYRPLNMLSGEVMIHDDSGQKIHINKSGGRLHVTITAGNNVEITCDTEVTITAPTVRIVGNLVVSGTVVSAGNMTAAGIDLDTHTHAGVQTGSGHTGLPSG